MNLTSSAGRVLLTAALLIPVARGSYIDVELAPPVALVSVCDMKCTVNFENSIVLGSAIANVRVDRPGGFAVAGATGNFSYDVAASSRDGEAQAATGNTVRARVKPGAKPKDSSRPIEVQYIGLLFTPAEHSSAEWNVQFGVRIDSALVRMDDRTGEYTGFRPPAALTEGYFGLVPGPEAGKVSIKDGSDPDKSYTQRYARTFRETVYGSKGPAATSLDVFISERATFDRVVTIRTLVSAAGGGFAILDPEFTIPDDRPDLELEFDAPVRSGPIELTADELAVLTTNGVDISFLVRNGYVTGDAAVPEPTTAATAGAALIAILVRRKRLVF